MGVVTTAVALVAGLASTTQGGLVVNYECPKPLELQLAHCPRKICDIQLQSCQESDGTAFECQCPQGGYIHWMTTSQFQCVETCPPPPVEKICTVSDNQCSIPGLEGGCIGREGQQVRSGLANPRCEVNGGQAPTKILDCTKIAAIREEWDSLLDRAGGVRQGLLAGVVRLAFHDAVEFDIRNDDGFGADGCLSANTRDHDGLWEESEEIFRYIEPLWQQHCDFISRADLWALVAKFALEDTDSTGTMRGLLDFKAGRKDSCNCDAVPFQRFHKVLGMDEVVRIFETQMGMSRADGVTLLGAHTIGSMAVANSGFGQGGDETTPWVLNPTEFDNQYFKDLVFKAWEPADPDGTQVGQWNPFASNENVAMLNVDMILAFSLKFHKSGVVSAGSISEKNWCGTFQEENCARPFPGGFGCCQAAAPERFAQVTSYVNTNIKFLNDFAKSFSKMTETTRRGDDLRTLQCDGHLDFGEDEQVNYY